MSNDENLTAAGAFARGGEPLAVSPRRAWLLSALAMFLALAVQCLFPIAAYAIADEDLSLREEDAFKAAVDRVAPSVVKIETFGGLERVGQVLVGTGPTTGLAVSADGYIISSAFNFAQKPAQILVHLDDGTRLSAKQVATDHSRMLVLLKVTLPAGKSLVVPAAAPRGEMAVGQWAIALGRTFDGPKPSMSIGIVSAVNRIWGKAIQTDAKISPNNYGGPLVDIRGRVLGLLAPMSNMGADELAGFEWYDSGIGFAVPLEDIFQSLDRLKKGKDLYSGLLGVSLKGVDMFADPLEIAAVQPNSPAYHAGFKAGDVIVKVDGRDVASQSQMKHVLGPHYAGDKVQVVVLRGSERIERTAELIDKLVPYAAPFLGILPMRSAGQSAGAAAPAGVTIRYVYPGSPAAKADLQPGDRITALQETPIKDFDDMLARLASFSARDKAQLTVVRGDKPRQVKIQFDPLPETIPPQLPPAHSAPAASQAPAPAAPAPAKLPAVGIVPIKIPEVASGCIAYVPTEYNPAVAYGVVIWLHGAGGYKDEELVARWKDLCTRHDLILLAPKSADPARWQRTELGFIRKTLDEVSAKYHVDRSRVVVAGQDGGGGMAFLAALTNRDRIAGVAVVDAAIPSGSQPPTADPVARLAFYIARAEKSATHRQIEETVTLLRGAKLPVSTKDLGPTPRPLSADELAELARWVDSLDRL